MDDIDSKPVKTDKTKIKLRARVKAKHFAPGGDLSKIKQCFTVEVLMNGKWKMAESPEGPMRFDTEDEAQRNAKSLDGLEVDIS